MNKPKSFRRQDRQRGFLNPNIVKFLVLCSIGAVLAGVLLLGAAVLYLNPRLPSLDTITDYRPKIPLRIYSADNVLIGEFGEERRDFIKLADIPEHMKQAVISIEDARFYQHDGIDYIGIARAIVADILHGSARQGASTITMQVARNLFLSQEKTIWRKLNEVLLARKIEAAMTKDQILEIYMNHIFLGQRAYGFAAAARTYFNKDIRDITAAEAAMLAGLPKAPSAYNPISNPHRAHIRQQYILSRMRDLGYLTQAQYDAAIAEKIHPRQKGQQFTVHADFVAEMVRQSVYEKYRENTYTQGIVVHTTIIAKEQEAGYHAVRKGVLEYDRRHGYRGPEAIIKLPDDASELGEAIDEALSNHSDRDELQAGIVTEMNDQHVKVALRDGNIVTISGAGLAFARTPPTMDKAKYKLQRGALVRVIQKGQDWEITQIPQVEAALVSLSPKDGGIRTLIGGFDFDNNKFNHVTQAWRQPGSAFKPFVYSAALEKGFGPATMISDAPLSYQIDPNEPNWEPKDDKPSQGPVTLRTALTKSVNLAAIRTLEAITPRYAQEFISEHFGFDRARIPAYLSMALGAGHTTPLQLSTAYTVIANGGYKVRPYLISHITDANGNLISKASPLVAGQTAPRTLDARNAYIMHNLLQSVAQNGTGAATNQLGRRDLAGKTGTTNNAVDGWFAGYQTNVVAVAWMGYDQPRSLGGAEFGSRVALPIWMDYMRQALAGVPEYAMPTPEGLDVINGELYFDNMTPGHGFVSSVDIDFSDAVSNLFNWGGSDKQANRPKVPDEHEPAEIVDGTVEKQEPASTEEIPDPVSPPARP